MNIATLHQKVKGIFPAIPTTLTSGEELDEPAQRRVVEFLLEGGVHGLWVLGSGGEGAVLTDDVRLRATQVIVESVAGRVPVIVGAGEAGTRRTIERIRRLEGLGVDAVSVTAPYYYVHASQDLLLHFETILTETDLPIMIYHNIVNTHNAIGLDVVQQLTKHERIIGIKDSGGNFSFTLELLRYCQGPSFKVFQGWEDLLAASFLMGVDGAVVGVANFAPRLACDIYEAARVGDRVRSMTLQAEFNDLIPLLGENNQITDASFIGAVKAALACQGLCGPAVARPLSPISPSHGKRIKEALEAKGLLSKQLIHSA